MNIRTGLELKQLVYKNEISPQLVHKNEYKKRLRIFGYFDLEMNTLY